MKNKAQQEYRYNRLTWPEMNEAIKLQKLDELREWPIAARADMHENPVQKDIRW